jgi:murein DD-endopeptidase MepM/ murein hydrolase activator NlpD
MLLNAESFGDMLNKAEYIEKLSEYDRNMLDEYRLVIKEVELSRDLLNEQKQVLDETKAAAEEEQENINTLIDEKKKQIEGFDSDIANNEAAIKQYDNEIAAQNSEIAALEAALAAEREQLDEATRIHYNGGAFTFPAPSYTRVSDSYGWRMHPTLHVEKFHNGVDLAAPGGSDILAAYDGVVVGAAYNDSMGNYVMIDHGGGLYTIYMHASKLLVSSGQSVSRGQKIALVGTTGRSTGNHLHFSVRVNGNYVSPWNYIVKP